ncbi:MAG: peptidoglycan bridge formation glycyltransferase FemA/FemB family protein [Oscillospiraceae bacterium]
MMEILDRGKYNEYEEFVQGHKNGGFCQSVNWAKLKNTWGHDIVVARDENGKIVGGMLVLIKKAPLDFSMLYSPHGPVCDFDDEKVLKELVDGIYALSKKHKGFLFKCDPYIREEEESYIQNFLSLGFKHKRHAEEFDTIQRRFVYILPDIKGKTEEEVINSFSQKTRYNIRVAIKKGVECRVCGKEGLDDYMRISAITAKRDNFDDRPKEYLERMLDCFGDKIRVYLCYYNGIAVSGAICSQYAGKTSYIFGASDNQYRNVMPNYLMQWEMIKWALQNGDYIYDFLGIPVNCDENSPMYGVYRFKRGFNGEAVGYAGEFDLVLNPLVNTAFNTAMSAKKQINKLRHHR